MKVSVPIALSNESGRSAPLRNGEISKLSMFGFGDQMSAGVEVVVESGVGGKEALHRAR